MSETFYEASVLESSSVLDGDGTEFLEGSVADYEGPPGDALALGTGWAEEFYGLTVE